MSLRQWFRPRPTGTVWYDPAYRWPFDAAVPSAADPRRADFAAWFLLEHLRLPVTSLRRPAPATWDDLARVHTDAWLEALVTPEALGDVFAVGAIHGDGVLQTVRLATGGTIGATREVLARPGAAMNLLGGFHHAAPGRGTGFCAVNDLAIAAAVARAEGFAGRIGVLDLDAHPPDGTAACLPDAWIGSISGADWGALPGVDETVLPDATPAVYLAALDALLERMPACDLVFVVAGADVLAGDVLGKLALDLAAARERDRRVYEKLRGLPSVWTPAGGYHPDAWRVTAATAARVAFGHARAVPPGFDPLVARYGQVARSLPPALLGHDDDDDDLLPFTPRRREQTLLGFYTPAGIELGLTRYGILGHLRRRGYDPLRIALDEGGAGDRVRLYGTADGAEHLLLELEVARELIEGESFLYVHWLTMRDPRAAFASNRPRLPGQEHPGLGLGPEATLLLRKIAERLHLAGVCLRPAFYHVAFAARADCRFLDPARQGRFEALQRDLAAVPLVEATRRVAAGEVLLNGVPYTWEAEPMVSWLTPRPEDADAVAAAREGARFSVG